MALESLRDTTALRPQAERRLGLLAFDRGDYGEAQNVFSALLKDPESSGIAVYYLAAIAERRGETAEISIADTGLGIAPEHRSRIFQLFFTTRPGGSGIGLASAYKAVQLHDGQIEFDSEVNRGTTFRIELPLARGLEPAFARARHAADAIERSS